MNDRWYDERLMAHEVAGIMRVPYLDGGYLEIDTRTIDATSQVFTYIDEDTGAQSHFDIKKLYEIAKANPELFPLHTIILTAETADHIRTHNGVDLTYVKDMTPKRALEPGLLLQDANGRHTILDGNHRYLKRFSMGRSSMRFYAFTEAEARPSMLRIPEAFGNNIVRQGRSK